ncbi:hypothetical protein LguiB_005416 [Lonicera macranthoides]
MEFFYISLLTFFVILVSLLFHFFYKSSSSTGIKLPPGKTGWPVIGESLKFLSTGWKGHPEKFIFDRMSKYSPKVFKTSLLKEKIAVFCGVEGNKFLFSNENKLVQAWWPASIDKIFPPANENQLSSSKKEAMKVRKMMPNFFKPESLRVYIGIMDQVAEIHFASRWDNKDEVVGLISFPIDLPGTPFRRGIKASSYIRKELITIIKQRKIDLAEGKATPTQDILSHMLTTSDEDGKFMNELDIANKILGLLIGGHDTTSSACTFILKYLAELPDVYDKVYNEQMEIGKKKSPCELLNWDDIQKMKYSWNVVCEILRLAPPLQGTFKEALTDFMYTGFTIPKGWKFPRLNLDKLQKQLVAGGWPLFRLILIAVKTSGGRWLATVPQTGISRDVQKLARTPYDPLKFDPSRFDGSGPAPYTFVPFGGGPRMCPGKEYARLEILVFMHHLVKRFKWEKVIPNEKIIVNPMPILEKGLPVRLYPHKA